MISRRVRVAENTSICKKHDIFGFYDSQKRTLSVCTDRIKTYGNEEHYIEETILHESVHVAQSCKTKNGFLAPLGIRPSSMSLTQRRRDDLKKTVALDPRLKHIDLEAYWMDDKPGKVKHVIQKYCL